MKDCPCQLCQLYVAQVPLVEPNTVYFIHSVFVSFYFICFLICFIFLLFVHLFIYLIYLTCFFACLFVCLFICKFIHLSIYLFIYYFLSMKFITDKKIICVFMFLLYIC